MIADDHINSDYDTWVAAKGPYTNCHNTWNKENKTNAILRTIIMIMANRR